MRLLGMGGSPYDRERAGAGAGGGGRVPNFEQEPSSVVRQTLLKTLPSGKYVCGQYLMQYSAMIKAVNSLAQCQCRQI